MPSAARLFLPLERPVAILPEASDRVLGWLSQAGSDLTALGIDTVYLTLRDQTDAINLRRCVTLLPHHVTIVAINRSHQWLKAATCAIASPGVVGFRL